MTAPIQGLTPSQLNYADLSTYRQLIRQALADTRCASPGFLVEDMNYATQTVTVQIAIQERVRPPAGPAQWWDIPPIVNVPVLTYRGGGFSTTLPLKKGNQGLLIFCDTCFDNWWVNGQTASPSAYTYTGVAPGGAPTQAVSGSQRQLEVRRHYVHDCGFLPGMCSQNNLIASYSADSLQVRSDDGNTIIDISESGVAITGASVAATDGGAAQALVNDTFYRWFVTEILPFLVTKGYVGPTVPSGSETTILKGQ